MKGNSKRTVDRISAVASEKDSLAGVPENAQQQHRADSCQNKQSCEDDRCPKQESLEAIQLRTGDGHKRTFESILSIVECRD